MASASEPASSTNQNHAEVDIRSRADSFQALPESQKFFSNKDDVKKVIDEVQKDVTSGADGDVVGVWILTMIDHWNNDHEKIVLLMEKTLYVVKYDFITRRVKDIKRIPLETVTDAKMGKFVYPPKSLMTPRTTTGVQLTWGNMTDMSFAQKWNPLCRTIPYTMFTDHPLMHVNTTPKPADMTVYDVCNFASAIGKLLEVLGKQMRQEEIMIESYGNLSSVVFNQSSLGFCKDRNGISF